MKNAYTNEQAFQMGLDSYYEDWSQEKINSVLVNCIDTDYFYNGVKTATDQDSE